MITEDNNKKDSFTNNANEVKDATVNNDGANVQNKLDTVINNNKKDINKNINNKDFGDKQKSNFKRKDNKKNIDNIFSSVLTVRRVTNVVKSGRILSFSVLVVCGDKKGRVGYALAKAKEVIDAKNKALNKAKKNMISINLFQNRTINHDQKAKAGASVVLVRRAKAGNGIIAGGPIRTICDHAGIQDIVAKSLGSRTVHNVVRAGFKALSSISSFTVLAKRKGMDLKKNIAGENKKESH